MKYALILTVSCCLFTSQADSLLLINKYLGKTQTIELNRGESKQVQNLTITLDQCVPVYKNTLMAFVTLQEQLPNQQEKTLIYSGWVSTELGIDSHFEHAIYDLQLLSCSTPNPTTTP